MVGHNRGHNTDVCSGRAKAGPMIETRFYVTIPCCAQECAQSISAKHASRIVELVVDSSLRGKATVFQKHASEIRLR